jgi:hypothetical protein
MLHRIVRLEVGLDPLGRPQGFGPLVGLGRPDQHPRIVSVRPVPYSRAEPLAHYVASTRRVIEQSEASNLHLRGVPTLKEYRNGLNNGRKGLDEAWARLALNSGVPPKQVFAALVREGARAQASPRSGALYAARTLSNALPARQAVAASLRAAASTLGIAGQALSFGAILLRSAVRLTMGRL